MASKLWNQLTISNQLIEVLLPLMTTKTQPIDFILLFQTHVKKASAQTTEKVHFAIPASC